MTLTSWDAICIGSGIGSLASASILAQMNRWRVLVLERHFKLGGCTHTFSRPGGWSWDVGLHYVGQVGPGMPGRKLFDYISGGGVDWFPMPDDFDHFHYPDFEFQVPAGEARFREALIARFPSEREAIHRYFRDLKKAMSWFTRHVAARTTPAAIGAVINGVNGLLDGTALTTTGEYLRRNFRDPRLRALLVSQWGDYGVAPARSAFVQHAIIASHYLEGAWYPEGGAGVLVEAIGKVIRQAGGELLANHEVTRIVTADGAATGVEVQVRQGKSGRATRFEAPVILSDAGAHNTYLRLLPPETPLPFRKQLEAPFEGYSVVTLYLGLRGDPRQLGFRGENHWLYDSLDHDALSASQDQLLEGRVPACYLSFPSLKESHPGRHTAEIIAPLSFQALERHRAEPWRRRSDEYQQAKQRIASALLDCVERRFPRFRDLVEYQELSTPLTHEHFTAAPQGAIYSIAGTPARFRAPFVQPRTPVRNLYLTGTDAGCLGITGALMGGIAAAACVLGGAAFPKILRAAMAAPAPVPTAR